ncbi:MAG TPA: hypothetical protein VLC28_08795, partial [Flavitalea sp.]|nr:hypothetical protein [Flavitalea sp.]
MKVLYLISVAGHGKGGHFHSLLTISEAMKEAVDVKIMTVGSGTSKLIESTPNFHQHIRFESVPGRAFFNEFGDALKTLNPDVVHCFDERAYLLLTLYLFLHRREQPVVLNKCGGPNSVDYPVAPILVLFSMENLDYYKKHPKFSHSSIHLIANRVQKSETRKQHEIFEKRSSDFLIFKIARISSFYQASLSDAIQLVSKLLDNGCNNVRLCIIGTLENPEVMKSLQQEAIGLPVEIITEPVITHKAADYLHYADMAICTGRGFMEASALGIPVLAKVKNSHLPFLVDEENFESFFFYNFSERTQLPGANEEENLRHILKVISDSTVHARYSAISAAMFKKHFDVHGAVPKYLDVYKEALTNSPKLFVAKNMRSV